MCHLNGVGSASYLIRLSVVNTFGCKNRRAKIKSLMAGISLLLHFIYFVHRIGNFIFALIGHVMRGCQLSAVLYTPVYYDSILCAIVRKKKRRVN